MKVTRPRLKPKPETRKSKMRQIITLSLFCFFPAGAFAQQGLVGQKTADARFSFQRVDEVLINQNRRVKLAGSSEGALNANSVKALERIEIGRGGVLRGNGKGAIFRVSGGSRQRVLPENFNTKESIDLASAEIPLTITLVKDKKSKDVEDIAASAFYVYIPEGEPDQAARQFVMEATNFSSFDEQLSAIEGFVRSFSQSAATQTLRNSLQAKLQGALNDYDGGASFQSVLDAQKLSVLAKKAFPTDVVLAAASAQIDSRIQTTVSACQLLRGLAGLGDWSSFLAAYDKIELHQDSFPDVHALHRQALEEEVRLETSRGRALMARRKDSEATREFTSALHIDRKNGEIEKERQAARMLSAQAEAKKNSGAWKPLAKDSPADRLFRQALYNADRAIQDKDYAKARDAIQQAERENADAPELLLSKASLLGAGDQISAAIPLLDRYDGLVTEPADREKGDAVRNQVVYELRKRKETSSRDIDSALNKGEMARLYNAATQGLKIDGSEPAFLYAAALSASILNKRDEAKSYLSSYLQSYDLSSDDAERARARRLLKALQTHSLAEPAGTANWFSGRKLPDGTFYCPASLAFQVPVESVAGFKFKMDYSWVSSRLEAIHSSFDDEKGRLDYSGLVSQAPGGQDKAQAAASLGTFSFTYGQTATGVRTVVAGTPAKDLKTTDDDLRLVKNPDGTVHLLNAAGVPQIVLENDRSVDPEVVRQVMGPVATVVSGNSYFNPFIWDGVHYFSLTYDAQGRVSTAREWNTENRVNFEWDNQRLTGISVFHGNEAEPVYQRTITYSGRAISSEEYTAGAHGGHIKYIYAKDRLTSAKIEDHGVHDGKTWVVRFQ